MSRQSWQGTESPTYVDVDPISTSVENFFDGNISEFFEGEAKLVNGNVADVALDVPASELDEQGFSTFKPRAGETEPDEQAPAIRRQGRRSAPAPHDLDLNDGSLRNDEHGQKLDAVQCDVQQAQREESEQVVDRQFEKFDHENSGPAAWVKAFDRVMDAFSERVERHNRGAKTQRYERIGLSRRNVSTASLPSDADYIADVTIACRRSLNERDFALWELIFVKQRYSEERVKKFWRGKRQAIKEQAGRLLLARRLSDLGFYFHSSYAMEAERARQRAKEQRAAQHR